MKKGLLDNRRLKRVRPLRGSFGSVNHEEYLRKHYNKQALRDVHEIARKLKHGAINSYMRQEETTKFQTPNNKNSSIKTAKKPAYINQIDIGASLSGDYFIPHLYFPRRSRPTTIMSDYDSPPPAKTNTIPVPSLENSPRLPQLGVGQLNRSIIF